MSDRGGDAIRSPPSENHDDDASSRSAVRLLQPRRSYGRPLFVLAVVALLVVIALSRNGSIGQLNILSQIETPPPSKRQDRMVPEQSLEPFKSLLLDAAQAYLVTGRLPVVTSGPLTRPVPTTP
jgi:hypothetical protein